MANIHKASFTFNSKGVHGNPCQLPDYKGGGTCLKNKDLNAAVGVWDYATQTTSK